MINQYVEFWRSISGYANYQISSHGRVRNSKTYRILKQELKSNGYKSIKLYKDGTNKHHRINRLVAQEFIDNPENKKVVDHIDGDVLNNHVKNLRWVTHSENCRNQKRRSDNTSGYRGISFHKRHKKYQCSILHEGHRYHLGYFDNAEDGAKVYDAKARELDPIHYKLNFDEID